MKYERFNLFIFPLVKRALNKYLISSFEVQWTQYNKLLFKNTWTFFAYIFYLLAPEVITNYGYSQQCDIWSLGVILFKL